MECSWSPWEGVGECKVLVKCKHAVAERHFDSDSDEELDIDDGMLVDGHGWARKTQHCTCFTAQTQTGQ